MAHVTGGCPETFIGQQQRTGEIIGQVDARQPPCLGFMQAGTADRAGKYPLVFKLPQCLCHPERAAFRRDDA